jgi:hypothetical protein
MPQKARIYGTVVNTDGSITSGRVAIYLRAKNMTPAQKIALDPPIVTAAISAAGFVEFFLEPNYLLLADSVYEAHIHTLTASWTETWIIHDTEDIDFNSLRGTERGSWPFSSQIGHEADIYNPHVTTIEAVLAAQPSYLIPADRVDLDGVVISPTVSYPTFLFEVMVEGEFSFTVTDAFDSLDPRSLEVFLNGLEQRSGGPNDFLMVDNTTIEFNRSLHVGELVEIRVLVTA